MGRLELVTLGKVDIRIDGRSVDQLSAHKAQALLIYLAMTRQQQSRQALSGLLWGDMPEANARRNLRVTLAKMRHMIEPYLLIRRRSLAIDPAGDVWLDAAEFEACLTPATPTLTQLQRAAALYHGHFLDDFNLRDAPMFEEWIRPLQERYRQMAMEALYRLARYHTDQRQYNTGIDYANRLLALEPWMEEAHRQLMLLLAVSGQRSAALAQYELCRDMLMEELGVSPAEATTDLYNQIRNEEIKPDRQGLPVVIESAPAAAPVQIPAPVKHFVGRADVLAALSQALDDAAGAPVHALVGMGGAGKSALAVQIARSVQETFSDGVLWANAAGSEPMAVLESWAAAYGYDFTRIADLESMAAAFRGVVADKRVLVVLDDVRSVSRIRPLLPGGDRCRVLLTTRDQDLARALDAHVWPLRELAPVNGRLLLATILGQERVAAEPEAAAEIAGLLQNLPLALEITAQRLKSRPRRMLAEMAQRLRDETQRLSLLRISDREVRASFGVSWESLDAERRRVFALIGLFNGRSFTPEALAYIADMKRFAMEDRLFDLVNLSLLREEEERRYRQHPLLADFAREQLGEQAGAENGRFVDYYLHFAQTHQNDYEALRPEWENMLAAMQIAYENELWTAVLGFADALQEAWFTRGRFSQARQGYRLAIHAAGALQDEAKAAQILLQWGRAAVEQRAHDQARALIGQSLDKFTALGDPIGVARCRCELARIALEQAHYDETRHMLRQSRAIYEERRHLAGLAEIDYMEARLFFFLGDYAHADEYARRALTFQQSQAEQREAIRTLSLLSSSAMSQGDLTQAEAYGQQAIDLCNSVGDQSEKTMILAALAHVYRLQQRLELAESVAEQSLAQLRTIGDLGAQAQVLYQLSIIKEAQQAYQEAMELGQQSLHLCRETHYPFLEAYVLIKLGDFCRHLQRLQEACAHWQEAFEIAGEIEHTTAVKEARQRLLKHCE